jgi:hypothetical protein
MSFLKKFKDVGEDLAEKGKRQAQRGKLELDVRRLEGKVNEEKEAIGAALLPLLESGALSVDNEDVKAHVAEVARLRGEIEERRKEIAELGEKEESPA